MRCRNKHITVCRWLLWLCALCTGAAAQHDSIRVRLLLEKANTLASANTDSAALYESRAEQLAQKLNRNDLLAQAYYLKAKIVYFLADYPATQSYLAKTMDLAQKNNMKFLLAKSHNLLGAVHFNFGEMDKALEEYNLRLKISAELEDTTGMIQSYYNITLILSAQGEHKKTVEATFKAIEIAEKKHDTSNLAGLYEGLGMAYSALDEGEKAITYLNRAYKLALIKDEEYTQGGILIDFGNAYRTMHDNRRALDYYAQAVTLTRKNGDKKRLGVALGNMGAALTDQGKYSEALNVFDESETINLQTNYTKGLSDTYSGKAGCFFALKQYAEAKKFALLSTQLMIQIKARTSEYLNYRLLSQIFEGLNDKDSAFIYFRKYVALRDTIESEAEIKGAGMVEHNYARQKIEQQRQHEQEEADRELRRQKQIRNIIMLAGAMSLGLLFFIWRGYSQTRRANGEIAKQKQIIEQQNAGILQDIDYARKIQEAILTPPAEIKRLLPESFVLYWPKDIVSGDFYFIEPVFSPAGNEKWVAVALADCTGHGVPGALMSLTGYNILKRSLREAGVNGPGSALDYLNEGLSNFLKQNQRAQQIRDGMDISFTALNYDEKLLAYAGANNPLWIVSKHDNFCDAEGKPLKEIARKNEHILYEIKATKQPIGYSEQTKPFKQHTLNLHRGDQIYLFTDGYADQFGGPKGKKFKYRQLEEIILTNAALKPKQQKQELENAFESWKGSHEQVDDVSLIGIKI